MSMAMILESGTGDSRGADGVKTAKLCVEQDQIGKLYDVCPHFGFRVDCLRSPVMVILEE